MKNILIALSLVLLAASCEINVNPGTGEKIGQVVKLQKEGMLSETWEAELIRGGMSGGSGAFGTTPFDFTIEDEGQVERIRKFMEDQTEVLVRYRREGVYACSRSGAGKGAFLVSIEPARK